MRHVLVNSLFKLFYWFLVLLNDDDGILHESRVYPEGNFWHCFLLKFIFYCKCVYYLATSSNKRS